MKSARSSASGLLTALLAGILERRAICLARSLITANNALFLLLAIRTLRPAGLGIGPATCLAGFDLTDLDLSRAVDIGRQRRRGARHDQCAEQAGDEQQCFHGDLLTWDRKKSATFF